MSRERIKWSLLAFQLMPRSPIADVWPLQISESDERSQSVCATHLQRASTFCTAEGVFTQNGRHGVDFFSFTYDDGPTVFFNVNL